MGTFEEGINFLLDSVDGDHITGKVEVDQVYAHNQHEHPEYHHPDGGEAFYLTTPLFAKMPDYMDRLARGAITENGSELTQAMIDNVEDLSLEVYKRAPWEFADLRASGHPMVKADGHTVYDRAPLCKRLTVEDLRIKAELSRLLHPERHR